MIPDSRTLNAMLHLSPNSPPLIARPFCWRPEAIQSGESLWSIFRLLAELNSVTAAQLLELLSALGVMGIGGKAYPKPDLLRFGTIDPGKLASLLNVSLRTIHEAAVLQYLKEDEIDSLASKALRFCSTCLRRGFHSTLHQFLFLRFCPIHDELLTERCQTCGFGPVAYDISSVAALFSSQVNCCFGASGRAGKSAVWKRSAELNRLADRLNELTGLRNFAQPIERWLGLQATPARRRQRLPWLFHYWQNTTRVPDKHLCAKAPEPRTWPSQSQQHSAIASRSIPGDIGINSSYGSDPALFTIYKSIYRHVLKTQLRPHRNCINFLTTKMWSDHSTVTARGRICIWAHAFVLWRMCFEQVRTPHHLGFRFRGSTQRATVYWTPPSDCIPRNSLHRIFSLECLAVFDECLLLAERFHRRNCFSFNTAWVQRKRLPYWVIQQSESTCSRSNGGSLTGPAADSY